MLNIFLVNICKFFNISDATALKATKVNFVRSVKTVTTTMERDPFTHVYLAAAMDTQTHVTQKQVIHAFFKFSPNNFLPAACGMVIHRVKFLSFFLGHFTPQKKSPATPTT